MTLRLSKALAVLAMALLASLVTFNNITDYSTNFVFVQHVFMMDTRPPESALAYRAITSPLVHHAGYVAIIALELLTALLCTIGGVRMLRSLRSARAAFRNAKQFAIAGLSLGFLTWQVIFMSVAGEWFAMWMSETWNASQSAFRFHITLLAVLIYVALPNDA